MPRKLFRNPEQEAMMPSAERPGPGTPPKKSEKKRPIERRAPRTVEQEEMAAAYSGEAAEALRHHQEREDILTRIAELKDEMKEMGGIWGEYEGKEYFKKNEEREALEAKLRLIDTGSAERPEPIELAAVEAPRGPMDEAREKLETIDEKKRDIEKRRENVEDELARYGVDTPAKLQEFLAEYTGENGAHVPRGFVEQMKYRSRKIGRVLFGKENMLDRAEVKQLLDRYVALENESSENIRERTEINDAIRAAEKASGRPRMRRSSQAEVAAASHPQPWKSAGGTFEGMGTTVAEAPEAVRGTKRLKEQLEALKREEKEEGISAFENRQQALRDITEEIEGYKLNLAQKPDEATYEDAQIYKDRLEDLHTRIRKIGEKVGQSTASLQALGDAEAAFAEYQRMAMRATEALQRGIDEATPGNQPMSGIAMRSGRTGTYGTGREARRIVELSRYTSANAEVQEKAEQMKQRELVNKDVGMYRSEEWRKNLLDQINADEAWRKFMHGVYEDVVARTRHLERIGEWDKVKAQLNSPDPALDYTLALFRGNATHADGGAFVYPVAERRAALAEIQRMDEMFLWGWRYKNVQENAEDQVKAEKRKEVAGERVMKPEQVEGAPMKIDKEAEASFEASLTEQPKIEKKRFKTPLLSSTELQEYSRLRHQFVQDAEKVETDKGTLYVREDANEKATLYPNRRVLVESTEEKGQAKAWMELKDYMDSVEAARKESEGIEEELNAVEAEPLPHVKRAMTEREQEEVEEEIPATLREAAELGPMTTTSETEKEKFGGVEYLDLLSDINQYKDNPTFLAELSRELRLPETSSPEEIARGAIKILYLASTLEHTRSPAKKAAQAGRDRFNRFNRMLVNGPKKEPIKEVPRKFGELKDVIRLREALDQAINALRLPGRNRRNQERALAQGYPVSEEQLTEIKNHWQALKSKVEHAETEQQEEAERIIEPYFNLIRLLADREYEMIAAKKAAQAPKEAPKVVQPQRKAPRPVTEALQAAEPEPVKPPVEQPAAAESRPIKTLPEILAERKKKLAEEQAAQPPAKAAEVPPSPPPEKKKKGRDYRQGGKGSPQDELAEILQSATSRGTEERLAKAEPGKKGKKGA